MQVLISLIGIVFFLFCAWLFSPRKNIPVRTIITGLGLQVLVAIFVLKMNFLFAGDTPEEAGFFVLAQKAANTLLGFSDRGAEFLFGAEFTEHFFAFKVLPTIIFIASLSQILFYWGILPRLIKAISAFMQKFMRISGAESLVTAANIFLGQTEAPLFIRPYLATMTRSELNVMMTGGMATVAGGVLAAYAGMGIPAGHLIAASFMSAPATIVIAKLMVPELEEPQTMGHSHQLIESGDVNVLEAAVNGAGQGLKLALNVGAMLIAFIALVAMLNYIIGAFGQLFGWDLSFESILGWCFQPFAFLMGVPWQDCFEVGQLLGKKVVLNEFIAYIDLAKMMEAKTLTPQATTIATYALCGFANFSSIAIQVGGVASLAPERRQDFARLGMRAMIGGNLAAFLTACIAGILLS